MKRRKRDQSRFFGRESDEKAPQRPESSSLRRHAQRSRGILYPPSEHFFVLFGQQPCWPAAILLAGSHWIFSSQRVVHESHTPYMVVHAPKLCWDTAYRRWHFPKTYLCQGPPSDSLTARRANGSAGRLLPLRSLYKQWLWASFFYVTCATPSCLVRRWSGSSEPSRFGSDPGTTSPHRLQATCKTCRWCWRRSAAACGGALSKPFAAFRFTWD